jgi:hypothetical protein
MNIIILEISFSEQYNSLLQLAAKFRNSGQTCVCANRVLVQEGILTDIMICLVDTIVLFCLYLSACRLPLPDIVC